MTATTEIPEDRSMPALARVRDEGLARVIPALVAISDRVIPVGWAARISIPARHLPSDPTISRCSFSIAATKSRLAFALQLIRHWLMTVYGIPGP